VRRWGAVLAVLVVLLAGCGGGAPALPVVTVELPAAEATVQPGEPVALRAGATHPDGRAVELRWDLGDGTTTTGPEPAPHVYAEPGVYVVTVTALADDGAASVPASRTVQVGAVAPPAANSALAFGGTGRDDLDRVKIALHDAEDRSLGADVGEGDMTLEFWMRAAPGDNPAPAVECGENVNWINGHVVLDRDRFNQGSKYGLSLAGGRLVFGVSDQAGADLTVCGATALDDDAWHHVAVTRTAETGAVSIWVDGALDGSVDEGPAGDVSYPAGAVPEPACGPQQNSPCTLSDPFLVIAAEKHDVGPEYPSYRGLLDELRLSAVARYTAPFPVPSARFERDGDTGALYHFDEGAGPVARDDAGSPPSDGILRVGDAGPRWVPSDAPTG
jgi:PKD repeat protein